MASSNEPNLSKRPHVKTERMQEFIRSQGEASSPKKLKCPHHPCDKVFTSNPGLKYHMQTHSVRDPQFSCRKCHRVFKSANGLKYHTDKTKCDAAETEMDIVAPPVSETENQTVARRDDRTERERPVKVLPAQLTLTPSLCGSPEGDMHKLRELAIIATSPLLQKHKSPWQQSDKPALQQNEKPSCQQDEKPSRPSSGGAIRSLEKLLNRRCEAGEEDLSMMSDTEISPTGNGATASFCDWPYREWQNAENIFPDGSDPRVSSSSPLCISPDETGAVSSNWSHTWPTAVWLCFVKGTKIKFLQLDESDWQLVDVIAEREELAKLASVSKTTPRYAEDGLCIKKICDNVGEIDQADIQVHFSPCLPLQPDILAHCQRDHPFYVKDKGWSSRCPMETVEHYGIPCRELCVGDVCLPQSHSDAAASEEIFIRNLEEYDLTPEDTSAVLTLSCMKQRKDSDLSPPPGSSSQQFQMLGTREDSDRSPAPGSASKQFQMIGTKEDSKEKAKRPPNAFMLFGKEQRVKYTHRFPKKDNRAISVMLGEQWKRLSAETRQVYEEKARLLAEEQRKKHPDCWKRKK